MKKDVSKQQIANLIQAYEQVIAIARQMYEDDTLKEWALSNHSLPAAEKITDAKKKLNDDFSIDYDAMDAHKKVIKDPSEVNVLVNHMDGMKGGTATIKRYSLPAMLSDVIMKDGMKMPTHKWMTNNEVKLK